MVFQSYSLFPNMTVAENISYGLRVRKLKSDVIKKRISDMLELVELQQKINSFPHQLSGGQQQRVALARALAIEPRVLLLDEPLSALDAQVRTQIRDEIRRIQIDSGTTTLFVTHDQEEAMAIADRVGVMQHGRLEQIDTPNNLYNKPLTPFVAGFVGLTNYVPAMVAAKGEVQVLDQVLDISEHSPAVKKGEEVRALIRPEELSVEKAQSGSTVITKSFLGPITRLGVDTGGSQLIYVEISSKEAKKFDTGDYVRLSINSDSVMVKYV
jgi:putative spermidine/putrescine transport system ATP-binding protein